MHVVIFEGSKWHTFAPLSLTRPVFWLMSGTTTLLENQIRHLKPSRLTLWVRPELAEFCEREIAPRLGMAVAVNVPLDDEDALLVSGRTLHFSPFEKPTEPGVFLEEGDVIRKAYVRSPGLGPLDVMGRTAKWEKLFELPKMEGQARMVNHIWDLISWNEESLVEDFVSLHETAGSKPAGPYHILNDANVWIGEGVKIEPGVVLDGSKGPVMLAAGSSVGANSVLKGPCFLGAHSQVKELSLILPGTTIGPICKVAGEVSNSILYGYTNKTHYGYLGDSYVGEWVNLGAGTTTSNLKNTYGSIKIRTATREMDTGRKFLGSLIGDHSKTAIGTRLMTGSYVGACSMIATSGLPPTFVPSFSFLTDKGREEYRIEKAVEVIRTMYDRRNKMMPGGVVEVLRYARGAAGEVEG